MRLQQLERRLHMKRYLWKGLNLVTITGLAAVSLCAQTYQRRADITGGDRSRGKCTIEVVVDGAAEVEIRGDTAVLRNLEGQPPQWRRFVCNEPMPLNPAGFRFAGVDGRGRQTLLRAPEGGAPAIVRIEDPQNGREGYTFDMFWQSGGVGTPFPPGQAVPPPPDRRYGDRDDDRGRDYNRDDDRFYREREDYFRGDDWRGQLFARVRRDLDYAARSTFRGDDRYRLDRTYRELDELQRDYYSGRWDRRSLDDVIQALDGVVDDNRLAPRDREILRDDLNRLRGLRDRR
jgi:hypothetical protein